MCRTVNRSRARVEAAPPYAAAAARYAEGVVDVFEPEGIPWAARGSGAATRTGVEAPLAFGKLLDYRTPRRAGDCKYL